jgi:hypothetical protein
MSATNQSFSVNGGDDYTIIFRNFDQNGNKLPLSDYTFSWTINTPTPIYKTSGNIDRNELSIVLNGDETKTLKGNYNHVLVVYDYNNKKYTLSKGVITFL